MKVQLNSVVTPTHTEVALFREMSVILAQTYRVKFIEETHVQYIKFHSTQVSSDAKREISDLWIIAFSPAKKRARMTFLQAKFHPGILDANNRIFNADYFQYELLSKRPKLIAISSRKFNFPLEILEFSCCNSIGAYGVFFFDKNRLVDLAYCSASALIPRSPLPKSYSSFKVKLEIPFSNTNKPSNCTCSICEELISCFDIDTFTKAIIDLQIGAELIHYPQVLTFLSKILAPFVANPAIDDLLRFIGSPPSQTDAEVSVDFGEIPTNILVINTDAE